MFKLIPMMIVVAISSAAHAKKAKEVTEQDYKAAVACLEKIDSSYKYNWRSGASPYTYDAKSKDHFVVIAKENAFVRFGSSKPQKCEFKMSHTPARDCIKITNSDGSEVVTMKYSYKEEGKQACNPKNPDSTTKYKYDSAAPCTDLSYNEMGQLLQKQILVNIEKLIVENKLSRSDFDAQYRKDCESVHKKLWDKIGMDFGATVSYAVKKAKETSGAADDGDKGTKQSVGEVPSVPEVDR